MVFVDLLTDENTDLKIIVFNILCRLICISGHFNGNDKILIYKELLGCLSQKLKYLLDDIMTCYRAF